MSILPVVIHHFDGAHLGIDPVDHVIHGKVNGQGLWSLDETCHNDASSRSVHPGGLNLGIGSGIRPEHEAMLGIYSN